MRNKMTHIWLLFSAYVTLTVSGLTMLKVSGLRFHPLTGLALLCYGTSFVLWMIIVNKMPLSLAMPLNVGLVNFAVFLVSALYLKENITLQQWIGAGVIILGVALVSQGGRPM